MYVYTNIYIYIYIQTHIYIRGAYDKFPDFLGGPMEVLLCERVNDHRHSLFHLPNCLTTTASKFFLELRE